VNSLMLYRDPLADTIPPPESETTQPGIPVFLADEDVIDLADDALEEE